MTLPAPSDSTLGAATERLLARAFAGALLITASAAAKLLGDDVKTLRGLTDAHAIRSVRAGKSRRYTEADIRAYLSQGPDVECRSTNPRKAASFNMTSSPKVVAFTARRASKPAARPRL